MKRQYKIWHAVNGKAKSVKRFSIYDQSEEMCNIRAIFSLETLEEPQGEYLIYDITGEPVLVGKRLPGNGDLSRLEYHAPIGEYDERS